MASPIVFFKKAPPVQENRQQPPAPQPGLFGRAWQGTVSGISGAAWGLSRPVAWAFQPVGQGIVGGALSEAERKIEQLIQPEGPLGVQLKQTLEQALLKQPPQELFLLVQLLKKMTANPGSLSAAEIKQVAAYSKVLAENGCVPLKQLAPDLSDQGLSAFTDFTSVFSELEPKTDEECLRGYKEKVDAQGAYEQIKGLEEVLTLILSRNQGAFVQSLTYLQQTLLSEESGVLSQAVEILTKKCTDEDNGLVTRVVAQLQALLTHKEGPIESVFARLTEGDESLVAQAVTLLQSKLLDKGGMVEQLGERFTHEEQGIVAQALKVARQQTDQLLVDALARLKNELNAPTGMMAGLKAQLTGNDGMVREALEILERSVFSPTDGVLTRLRSELTDKEKGILAEGLQKMAEALNGDHGILSESIRILNAGLLDKGGTLDLLEKRLLEKDTGILPQAISLLQAQLTGDGGLLDTTMASMQKRIIDEGGILDQVLSALDQRLNDQEKGILVQAQKFLSATMTGAIDLLNKKLREKDGPIDFLEFRLNDSETGILSRAADVLGDKLLAQGGVVDRLEERLNGLMTRTAQVLSDKISGTLNPILDRVEKLPQTMVGNLFGTTLAGPAPAAPAASTAPAESQEGSISQFLAYGSSRLSDLLGAGSQALSKQAFSSFASVLAMGIKHALGKMDGSEALKPAKETLTPILASLESADLEKDWATLSTYLSEAAKALSGVKVYVLGFRVPGITAGAEEVKNPEIVYSKNIARLQEAIDTEPKPQQNLDWKEMAQSERKALVTNSATFLTMKHIYEDICGLKPSDEKLYLRLMERSRKEGKIDEAELRAFFFEELVASKVNFATRTYAKVIYYFYGKIVKRFTERASRIYFQEIFKYIEQHKVDKFESLRRQVTENFTRYLTILGGAYKTVATTETPSGTLDEMLNTELEKKTSNLGFETQELYQDFAVNVMRKTTQSGFLTWIVRKWVKDPETIVRSLIDTATNSIEDTRGYTHALNTVIREQLDEIWEFLKAGEKGENPDSKWELSGGKKAELAALVKNLFEILRKSKCGTVDELRDLINGKLLSARVNQAVDDLFIEEILEKVTHILAITIQSLVQEDQLQKLTYKFANLVNRTFEVGEEVTEKEMQDEERQIAKRCEQILRLTINTAIDDKFDFTGKKQQDETNRSIEKLHEDSAAFFASAKEDLERLDQAELPPEDKKSILSKVLQEANAYESDCQQAVFQAKGSRMSSDNLHEISKRHLEIAKQSKPFVKALVKLKKHASTLEDLGSARPDFEAIKRIIIAIGNKLSNERGATEEDYTFAEAQLNQLQQHLDDLKKRGNAARAVEQMTLQTRTMGQVLVRMRSAARLRAFATGQLQPNSPLEQLVARKKAHSGTLKDQFAAISQEIRQAAAGSAQLHSLLRNLAKMESCSDVQKIDGLYVELKKLLEKASQETDATLSTERLTYKSAYDAINTAIEESGLLTPDIAATAQEGVRKYLGRAKEHLTALTEWEATATTQVGYINYTPIDMKGMQDWASGLVYNRVKERLDGFMGFLKREETYRYGLLNHLFLIPYTRSQRSTKRRAGKERA